MIRISRSFLRTRPHRVDVSCSPSVPSNDIDTTSNTADYDFQYKAAKNIAAQLPSTWKHASPLSSAELIPRSQRPTPRYPASILNDIQDALVRMDDMKLPHGEEAERVREWACLPDKFKSGARKGKIKASIKRMLSPMNAMTDAYEDVQVLPAQRPRRPVITEIVSSSPAESNEAPEKRTAKHSQSTLTVSGWERKKCRVSDAVQKNLWLIVRQKFAHHPALQTTKWSITDVEVSSDLSNARVYWLPIVLNGETDDARRLDVERALKRHAKAMRWHLTERMKFLRKSPQLLFCYDQKHLARSEFQRVLDTEEEKMGE